VVLANTNLALFREVESAPNAGRHMSDKATNRDLRDLSKNIKNGANNGGRQKRYIVKIYFALEKAVRARILAADAGILLQSGRVGFRFGCTQRHHTRGKLC
jgi:hypothetical protein